MRKTLWAAVLVAAACLISFRSTYEPDLWWHLAQGRETAAGHIVRTNVFSAAYRDYPQPYTSWLFDLGGYVVWTRVGPRGMQALQALLIALSLGAVALACRLRSSTAATVAVCALGWIVLEPRALPRPHLVSFAGMAAMTYLIERSRVSRSWRPLLWTVPVTVAWANFHVECIFGVALVGFFAAGEWILPRSLSRREARGALLVALGCVLATLVTPYGMGLWRYTFENSGVPRLLNVAELQPPYLPNYRGFFALTALTVLACGLNWRRMALGEAFSILVFGALGWRYLRLTPLLFFACAPAIAQGLDAVEHTVGTRGRPFRGSSVPAGAVAVLALLLSRVPIPGLVRGMQAGGNALEPGDVFSPAAMRFAREHHLTGPAFTSINLGGYVAWQLYPDAQVFIDSRLQAYPPEHFRAVDRAAGDRDAWEALTQGVDWAILSVPRVNPFSGTGRFDERFWGTAYRDQAIEILVRRHGHYGGLAREQ
jgi:hypothetical protein